MQILGVKTLLPFTAKNSGDAPTINYIDPILVEVAWRAIREDRNLFEIYNRIKSRRESKRAIVAVARKILIRLRKCLKDQVLWQDMGPLMA